MNLETDYNKNVKNLFCFDTKYMQELRKELIASGASPEMFPPVKIDLKTGKMEFNPEIFPDGNPLDKQDEEINERLISIEDKLDRLIKENDQVYEMYQPKIKEKQNVSKHRQ